MHNNIEMNKYLADSDSEFNDFKSVASSNLPKYIEKYNKKHGLDKETLKKGNKSVKDNSSNKAAFK